MTIYTVHFRNYAASACEDIEADTPEQALALALARQNGDSLDLWFEPYDMTSDINEIVISDEAGNELASWIDDDLRLCLAGQDLLDVLKQAVEALNTAPRFEVRRLDTDSHRIALLCDQAIRRAQGDLA